MLMRSLYYWRPGKYPADNQMNNVLVVSYKVPKPSFPLLIAPARYADRPLQQFTPTADPGTRQRVCFLTSTDPQPIVAFPYQHYWKMTPLARRLGNVSECKMRF